MSNVISFHTSAPSAVEGAASAAAEAAAAVAAAAGAAPALAPAPSRRLPRHWAAQGSRRRSKINGAACMEAQPLGTKLRETEARLPSDAARTHTTGVVPGASNARVSILGDGEG
jgi:hypothetical protein